MKVLTIIKNRLTAIVSLIIIIIVLGCIGKAKKWRDESVISWDIISYYAYLPAVFIYHDYTLKFTEDYKGPHKFTIWNETAPNGAKVIKMSMGLSICYAPFFFIGHIAAHLFHYDTGGYSTPYKFALMLSSVFFLFVGLYYLSKILLKYFNQYISSLVLFLTVIGTNLFYYVAYDAPYSHPYSFALIAMFIWYSILWYETFKKKYLVFIGLLFGLISLIRPTNILVILFFILWDIKSLADVKERAQLFYRYKFQLLLLPLLYLLVWSPQMLYWKSLTGQWLYYSYGNQKFFFNHPMIIPGLFGYRHGWLIYSPVMILSVAGFLVLWKEVRAFAIPIIVFFLAFIYVIFSWWCWWYGGAFGLRAMIDIYALMAVSMAALIRTVLRWHIVLKSIFFAITLIFLLAGLHNIDKFRHWSIHWDSNTRESFWDNYMKVMTNPEHEAKYKTPDYEAAMKGQEEYQTSKK